VGSSAGLASAGEREQGAAPRSGWPLALVLGLTLAAFAPALAGGLVYDDLLLVARNPALTSLASLPSFFSEPYWDFLDAQAAGRTGYWRPLTALALCLVHQVAGTAPAAYHAASLALHLAATALVFRLARRLGLREWSAAAAALLFGIHPVQVESVAWISAVNAPLSGVFVLLALLSFVAWRRRGAGGAPAGAAAWLALALLAKETALAAPAFLLLLDVLVLERDRARRPAELVRAHAPFLAVLVLYWMARALVFGDLGAGFDRTTTDFDASFARAALIPIEILGGALGLLLWPARLGLFHALRPEVSLLELGFALPAALVALFLVAAVWFAVRRERLALAALLLVPAGLLPVLLRPQALGAFPLSERFLYLPVVGLALLAGRALSALSPRVFRVAAAAFVLVAGALAARTVVRIRDWRNEIALFASAAAVEPESPYVRWQLGRALLLGYRERPSDAALLAEARSEFARAAELVARAVAGDGAIYATRHDDLQARLGLAWCELHAAERQPRPDFGAARASFLAIARDHPDQESAFAGLGTALLLAGELPAAEEAFRRCLALDPKNAEAHYNLGRVYEAMGAPERAAEHFALVQRERPERVEDLLALARASLAQGDAPRARELVARAQSLDPESAEAAYLAGMCAASAGRAEEALELFARALELDPTRGLPHLQRAKTLIGLGRAPEAHAEFLAAAELLPDHFEAQYNAGAFLLSTGDATQARTPLVRAYEIGAPPGLAEGLRAALAPLVEGDRASLLALARADLGRGDPLAAERWLDAAARAAPGDVEVEVLRAHWLRAAGRDAEARELVERLRTEHGDEPAVQELVRSP
jgi:tetratricopeptide (TPR) repeat protein